MADFVKRLRKWFKDIGSGMPGDKVNATFRGVDNSGNPDPIGDGVIGKVYEVILLSGSKLFAPCPPFCTGEAPDSNDIDDAVKRTLISCGKAIDD